jgi:flagellar FliL protein
MTENDAPPGKNPAGRGSRRKWLIVTALVVGLGAAGFLGYFLYAADSGDRPPVVAAPEAPDIKYPLDAFIVNLRDENGLGKRYLKLTMLLVAKGEESRAVLDRNTPEIRDTVLLLLSSRTCADVSSTQGKLQLKEALLSRINALLGEERVTQVLFTEFVIQ